jgi:hypothetical protein
MQTDFLLFQIDCNAATATSSGAGFRQFCINHLADALVHRIAYSNERQMVYGYAKLATPTMISLDVVDGLQALWAKAFKTRARVSRLHLGFAPECPSQHETPHFHYVVETDTDAGWWGEIVRWYDAEHMLGLAHVPGCVSAMRLINLDAKCEEGDAGDNRPRSFACYDLASPDVLASAPWLAVRHTAWSDVARPHFTNTLRTMMHIIES